MSDGAQRILAIDPRTHAFDELRRFPPPADPQTSQTLTLAGSGGVVTATLDLSHDVTDETAEQATPTLMASRAFTVLPAPAALASCDPVNASFPSPIRAAGGDDFVALAADDCGSASAVHLRLAGGTHTIPAETGRPFPPPEVFDLRAAGPYAAWTEHRFDNGPQGSFVAVDAATGDVLLRSPLVASYALGSDGTIVVPDPKGCAMRVVSLSPLAQRTAPLPAGLCPGYFGAVAVAGGRVVYPVVGSYGVSDLHGAAHLVSDLPVEILPAPIAFDGHTLFGVRRRCQDELLLAVDTDVAAGAALPSAPPPSLATCPVRRAGSSRVRVAADGRVSIRVSCPNGCRGTLRLVEQRRGRRERRIASADFVSGARTFVVRPRVARYARALAGCRGGLRAVAQVHRPGDATKGLGAYRILSHSSCRRTGGPAFATPRP
jgi:hypothetical protein